MPKVLAILAAPFLLLALAMGASGVMLVDVREGGPDGTRIVIPVPLLLAQAAVAFAPEDVRHLECPELARWAPIAEAVLAELRTVEDFTLVEVREADEHVIIRKTGDALTVDISGDEEVHLRVPLRTATRVLRSYDGKGFSAQAAIRALRGAPRGKLVHVKDGEDEVKIRLL